MGNLADKKKLEKEREALGDKDPPKPIPNLCPQAACGPGWLWIQPTTKS